MPRVPSTTITTCRREADDSRLCMINVRLGFLQNAASEVVTRARCGVAQIEDAAKQLERTKVKWYSAAARELTEEDILAQIAWHAAGRG